MTMLGNQSDNAQTKKLTI